MERAVLKQEDPPLEIGGPSPLASAFAEERHLKRTSKLGNSLPVWKPGDGRIDSERHTLPPRPPSHAPAVCAGKKDAFPPAALRYLPECQQTLCCFCKCTHAAPVKKGRSPEHSQIARCPAGDF